LFIHPGVRANITKHPVKTELTGRARMFRRFLRNARINDVSQVGFERIMEFHVTKASSAMKLIVELMPRGVMVAAGEGGKVLISSKDLNLKDRVVRPGLTYQYPPLFPDPRTLTVEESLKLLEPDLKLGSALIKGLGLPPEVINEVLPEETRLIKVRDLGGDELRRAVEAVKSFIEDVLDRPAPTITECGGIKVSFQPFIPERLPALNCRVVRYPSLSDAVDEFFRQELSLGGEERVKDKELGKALATLRNAEENLRKLQEGLESLEREVRFFEENYADLESAWRCVREKIKAEGWGEAKKCSGVSELNPREGVFTFRKGEDSVEISVKDDFTAQFFELRRKVGVLKRKLRKAEESVEALKRKVKEREAVLKARERKVKVVKKVEWFHSYHWVVTRNGFLAIGGRDVQQNEKVVKKYLRDDDIFVHASIHGASAFVLKSGGAAPSEDLRDVAVMAVSYSKGWRAGAAALDAFWVWGRQVSKSPPPGEYLPRGSFMIYGRKNIIKDVELRLAVGIRVIEDKYFEVVAGPEDILRQDPSVVVYAVIVPGDLKPHEVAKRILNALSHTPYIFVGLREDDVASRIPGGSRILDLIVRSLKH
ncbi:MAG: NFACT family protein, partial [Desulfurococcales archaeon]|nr:NFACT family protein [Desulfurococcales archaeon]